MLQLIICHLLQFIAYSSIINVVLEARIAQLVEQWIEDPRVTSSNLVLGN